MAKQIKGFVKLQVGNITNKIICHFLNAPNKVLF